MKGKLAPVALYEVLDGEPALTRAQKLRTRDEFAAAMACFRARAWSEAEAGFSACEAAAPSDGAAKLYLARCRLLRANDPGPGWDGVMRMAEK